MAATSMSAKDRKSTRLNSSHDQISYAVFCLKKKKVQEAMGLGMGRSVPSGPGVATSTMHWRQEPTGSSSGWSQNRGIWMLFFFNDTATTEIYTLSLHDALPI